jgi:hypothetical protein
MSEIGILSREELEALRKETAPSIEAARKQAEAAKVRTQSFVRELLREFTAGRPRSETNWMN